MMNDETSTTVFLENVNKHFSVGLLFRKRQLRVLQGINLQVNSGSIFGLLGPSGCGKTTLLKCIVGRLIPDSGIVSVFGHRPGSQASGIPGSKVGYMPQDIGLTEELNIVETLQYFGKTAGMDSKTITKRTQFLLKLLRLDHFQSQLVGNLSGGQKRRVSFAVALIHEASLLILDEPTVGLDPIMRKSIWDHLQLIVSTSATSIIITTHYVEEARSADQVGLMLDGKIVASASPNSLIQKHKCSTLEDVFLSVSLILNSKVNDTDVDEKPLLNINSRVPDSSNSSLSRAHLNSRTSTNHRLKTGIRLSIARFMALVLKTVIFSFRNPASIVLEVIVPPLLLTTFAISVGKPLFDLEVGVLNYDEFDLGQMYLGFINPRTIKMITYNNIDEAEKAYAAGHVWAFININYNFSNAIMKRTTEGILTDNITLAESSILIKLDESNSQVALVITSEMHSSFQKFSRAFLTRQGLNSELNELPVKVNGKGEPNVFNYRQFLIPGFLLSLTYFTAMGATALNRATEKQMGCTDRLCVAGVTAFDLVFSEFFVHLLMFVLETILDFIVLFWIFEFECKGSMFLAFMMTLLHGVCGMSFGIMVSAITDYVGTAMITCIGIFFVGIMMQGVLWPIEGMAYAVRYTSMTLTTTLPAEGMRSIMNRAWGITYFPVYMGFVMSIIWSMLFLSGSLIAFHLRM